MKRKKRSKEKPNHIQIRVLALYERKMVAFEVRKREK